MRKEVEDTARKEVEKKTLRKLSISIKEVKEKTLRKEVEERKRQEEEEKTLRKERREDIGKGGRGGEYVKEVE